MFVEYFSLKTSITVAVSGTAHTSLLYFAV